MTSSGHNSHLFSWKRLESADKTPVKHDDIDQWRKRVEEASEFAVSEVFFRKKTNPGSSGLAVPLQNSDQLRDHDDAYSEAQALLGDWLGTKLRLELEVDDEDALRSSAEKTQPAAPAAPTHSNFDDLYKCLAEEEEESAVNSVLQDLMEQELLDSGMMEELSLDDGEAKKKLRNPIVAMEARRQQVRENGVRRRAERQRRRREEEARREARKEAGRREREEEAKKTLERRRQEEMLQQEMVRLRRQMEERRVREQLGRQREREKEAQSAVRSVQSTPALPSKQQPQESERLRREQEVQMKNHVRNLKCLHRHFSGWHSAVMERRLRTRKAVALCDWRRQLRAWRAWRTVAWAERERREVARTDEALRMENRQVKLAAESDRRRLLRRCLNAWQLWRRVEKVQRELAARQQETKQKMAALLTAASTGKLLATGAPADQPITAPPAPPNQSQETDRHRSDTLAPRAFVAHRDQTPVGAVPRPSGPWRVTRRHAAPDAAELCEARRRLESGAVAGRFESRHAAQQRIIAQQRKLLKEQQEQIARLKGEQDVMGLELEMEKAAQLTQLSVRRGSRPKSCSLDPKEQSSAPRLSAGPGSRSAPPRQTRPHPIITAMEARARRREERRREIEELKRRKEEEKLAEMKAAEERRQREEEEEKRRAAEKRREETRLEREREEEKRRQQELTRVARQHRHRSLLSRRGLAPWKRLMQLKQASMELAEHHHDVSLLRRSAAAWRRYARESVSEREACAEQLHQHFLLRRSLNCWKRLRDARVIQEERAERFHRGRTLRRFLLALLDHMARERLAERDHLQRAREHSDRRLLRRCLRAWRRLPGVLRGERRRDERRERLSRKVAEVLLDFRSRLPREND
ncbi:coiled-coil domain-containing protein 191 [Kryptolebias marmoratus]|uniref:coiled-coil domain-containing protein 191 n=1 Tax=Kryptolebias marmoratus TaxID=37003 RepID=UPI0007F8CC72|nr:coiled-coil domain-containing protein 191 [Kryptolebias marmoratus]